MNYDETMTVQLFAKWQSQFDSYNANQVEDKAEVLGFEAETNLLEVA